MNYFYEATDAFGETVLGKLDAADEADLHRKLERLGYRPHSIAANHAGSAPQKLEPQAVAKRAVGIDPPQSAPRPVVSLQSTQAIMPAVGQSNVIAIGQSSGALQRTDTSSALHGRQATQSSTVTKIHVAGNAARVAGKLRVAKPVRSAVTVTAASAVAVSNLGGVSTRDRMLFFRQLASLVHSGMTVYAALDNLAARTRNQNLARTAQEMTEQAKAGGRISDVMEQYPRIYDAHITGMVRAGEMGGFLEIALEEIALKYEQNIALYRGSWFPKFLATQGLFLVAAAQPIFPALYAADLNPVVFLAMYAKALLFRNLPIALAIYLAIRFASNRLQLPKYRHLRDSWSLKLPPFGNLQRKVAIASFVRMLRRLYHAGVSPTQSWEGAMNTASNVVIRDQLASSYELMQSGVSLPEAFSKTGLFADEMEQLILTGQQSGQVVESLDQIADYYQAEVDDAFRKSQFTMMRFGCTGALILGGVAIIYMAHTYFFGMFTWVDHYIGE